ncbi:MAG: type VI secretion system lipoprotein TssJ [Gammaproteobacteria bacterium]|nr:type VI secretion system lipoprotein TssJ [Gammaproteobacteria bacterium]
MCTRTLHPAVALPALLLALFLASCKIGPYELTKKEPPQPTRIDVTFTADDQLNLTPRGSARPLAVRIYELKSYKRFQNADYFPSDKAKSVLGEDLLASDELDPSFAPGESRRYPRKLQPETRFIGIAGAFNDIDKADWHKVVKVTPHETNNLIVKLKAKAISAENLKDEGLIDPDKVRQGMDDAYDTAEDAYDTAEDVYDAADKARGTYDKWGKILK